MFISFLESLHKTISTTLYPVDQLILHSLSQLQTMISSYEMDFILVFIRENAVSLSENNTIKHHFVVAVNIWKRISSERTV